MPASVWDYGRAGMNTGSEALQRQAAFRLMSQKQSRFRIAQGISGIADSNYVKLMVLKALGSEDGSGSSEGIKQAIRYAEANGAVSVDIAAPGTYILSTVPGGYGFMSGTSMAAPMVTGTAALVYSSRPDFDLMDVKQAIIGSARKLDTMTGKSVSGGILDAYGAITYGQT